MSEIAFTTCPPHDHNCEWISKKEAWSEESKRVICELGVGFGVNNTDGDECETQRIE